MTSHEQAHAEHMERVYAVQRRSAYERVLSKIAYYQNWERDAATDLVPAMDEEQQRQLTYLRELRESLRREMIDHGQITADA